MRNSWLQEGERKSKMNKMKWDGNRLVMAKVEMKTRWASLFLSTDFAPSFLAPWRGKEKM